MTNAVNTMSVDAFLAAADVAGRIKYRWEQELLGELDRRRHVPATYPSNYVFVAGRALAGWQVERFVSYGLMTLATEYDRSNPQSMFDAPVIFNGYRITDLGKAVARLVAKS